ncbi:MAG: putative molibdopterin-dependent oxidoreductase YjgC [Algoriphagus sp.]
MGIFQVIGWDIVINQKGQIMEWNTDHPRLIFSEMATEPSFKGLQWENLWK